MNNLTVYYDGDCSLCCRIRAWLTSEPQIVRLRFVDRGSEAGRARLGGSGFQIGPDDLVVVADDGRVWAGDDAWLMVLYALDDFRLWSYRLANPEYRPLLRRMIGLLSRHRIGLGRWLDRSLPSLNWLIGQAQQLPAVDGGCLLPDRLLRSGRGMGD